VGNNWATTGQQLGNNWEATGKLDNKSRASSARIEPFFGIEILAFLVRINV
jgi:hypothetical protein